MLAYLITVFGVLCYVCCFFRYKENNSTVSFPSQKHFRAVWTGFVHKQNWDRFSCPFCRRPGFPYEVDKVICDGVAIGVQKKRCTFLINPKETLDSETIHVNMGQLKPTRFAETKKDQQELLRYVVTCCGAFQRDHDVIKMDDDELRQFHKFMMDHTRYKNMAMFMDWANAKENDDNLNTSYFLKKISRFLLCFLFCFFALFFALFLFPNF